MESSQLPGGTATLEEPQQRHCAPPPATCSSASSEEAAPLLPALPQPPEGLRTARSRTHTEADKPERSRQLSQQQQLPHPEEQPLIRLNPSASSPRLAGSCSRAARRLGKFVDDSLYAAFLSGPVETCRRCVGHVIDCLRREILHPAEVRSDLQAYRADVGGNFFAEVGDFSDARQTLCELECQVGALRDRLLYPLHYQQLMDLSHVCGCIHSVRMRLGFVPAQPAVPSRQASGESLA